MEVTLSGWYKEEANPGVLTLLSPKLEKLGSCLVSSSLLDNSGFEEEVEEEVEEVEDDRDSKRHELHGESNQVSVCFSPVPVLLPSPLLE